MIRVLIVTPSFSIGGTNSSLCAFLSQVKTNDLSIDILAKNHCGYYRNILPNCRILEENVWICDRIIYGSIIKKYTNYFLRGIKKVLSKCGYDAQNMYIYIGGIQIGSKDYDAVISYQEDFSGFITNMPANKRIAWIRCEYDRYYEIHNHIDETKIYNIIDKIVCVSQFARNSFVKYYPKMDEKTVVIHNFMDVDGLRILAKKNEKLHNNFDDSSFTIVSIGRIDRVKQFEMIPLIAKEINNKTDKPFKWYIIGGTSKDLELFSLIKNRITDNGLDNVVFLLGEINNVAPYLSKADIFVHTSKSETFSRVVNEAKVLGVPPVVNDYACAPEFVNNGVDGFIVNNTRMSEVIIDLMNNPHKLELVKESLKKNQIDNEILMDKIMGLF